MAAVQPRVPVINTTTNERSASQLARDAKQFTKAPITKATGRTHGTKVAGQISIKGGQA